MILALSLALSVQHSVATYLQAPVLRSAHVGVLIVDAQTRATLASHDADDAFTPASNMKLLVGSVARAKLGPSFTYTTRVAYDGNDLYLIGGGDAHLTTANLDQAAQAIADAHIMTVGKVLVDTSRYQAQRYGPGWSIDDIPYDYAAPVSAISPNENTVHIHIIPAHRVGEPVTLSSEPQSDAFTIINDATTGVFGSKDTTDIVRPWNSPTTIRITGSYPLGASTPDDFDAAVPDPQAYAGDLFVKALQHHGIQISAGYTTGIAPVSARTLWTHASATLPTLLAQMWLPSDNLMAELLLRELGVQSAGPPGSITSGAGVERTWLQSIGVDPHDITIADGSGLSVYDRLTPRTLVAILTADWNTPWRDDVIMALPVAGKSGTLREAYIGTPAAGNVIAKTGTLSHVRTISGFVRTRHHGMLIFSLLINDLIERSPQDAAALSALDAHFFSQLVEL